MQNIDDKKIIENNQQKLKNTVYQLVTIYLMTFLGGFLQATVLNFINYVFFSLFLFVGVVLIKATVKSKITKIGQYSLFLTGGTSILLATLFIFYESFRLLGLEKIEASIEDLLYLLTLVYLLATIASLILIRKL